MPSILSKLMVIIGADASPLDKETKRAARSIDEFGKNMERVGGSLALSVTAPIVGVGVASLQAAAKMETASTAFRTLMGSADAANKHLEQLRQFALKTPFQFSELIDASRRMQALGFTAQEVLPKLNSIGNAVSALGMGADGINRVVLALGQMKAKGTVQAEEMRQLAEAGIPAWDALAKKLGVDIPTAMKMVEKRSVDAATGVDAIMKAMERFSGGMEAQSKTLGGIFSNVKDAIQFTLADVGKTLAPMAKDVMLNYLQPMLDKVKELAASFAALPKPIQDTALAVTALSAALPVAIMGIGALLRNFKEIVLAVTSLTGALSGSAGLSIALRALPWAAAAAGAAYLLNKLVEHRQVTQDTSENAMRQLNARLKEQSELASGVASKSMGDLATAVFAVGVKHDEAKPKIEAVGTAVEQVRLTTMGLADTLHSIEQSRAYEKMEQDLYRVMEAARKTVDLIPAPDRDMTRPGVSARPAEDVLRTPTNLPDLRVEDQIFINIENNAEAIAKRQEELGAVIKTKTVPATNQLGRQISTIFTDMSRGIARAIVDWKGFKDVGISTLKSLGEAVLRHFIENGINLAIKAVGVLLDHLGSVGKAIGSIIGAGGSAAGSVISAGGSAAGSAGSAAGGVGGAVSGGIAGVVGAVGSVVGAVSGIIGNFQMHGMGKDLGRIEENTRQCAAQLIQGIQPTLNQYMPGIIGVEDRLKDIINNHIWRLHDIWEQLVKINNTDYNVKIYLDGKEMTGSIVRQIKAGTV